MLRVMLVDDTQERSFYLRLTLERLGYEVVAEISNPRLLHDEVLRLSPDAIIVDTNSPSRDTLENLCMITESCPRPMGGVTDWSSAGLELALPSRDHRRERDRSRHVEPGQRHIDGRSRRHDYAVRSDRPGSGCWPSDLPVHGRRCDHSDELGE